MVLGDIWATLILDELMHKMCMVEGVNTIQMGGCILSPFSFRSCQRSCPTQTQDLTQILTVSRSKVQFPPSKLAGSISSTGNQVQIQGTRGMLQLYDIIQQCHTQTMHLHVSSNDTGAWQSINEVLLIITPLCRIPTCLVYVYEKCVILH